MGIVEIVEHLSTVQDKVYDEPTVLVVDNVTGGAALGQGERMKQQQLVEQLCGGWQCLIAQAAQQGSFCQQQSACTVALKLLCSVSARPSWVH